MPGFPQGSSAFPKIFQLLCRARPTQHMLLPCSHSSHPPTSPRPPQLPSSPSGLPLHQVLCTSRNSLLSPSEPPHPLTSPVLSRLEFPSPESSCLGPRCTSNTSPAVPFCLARAGPLEVLLALGTHSHPPQAPPQNSSSLGTPTSLQESHFTPQNSPSSSPQAIPFLSTSPPLPPVPELPHGPPPTPAPPFRCPRSAPALTCSAPPGSALPATQ